MSNDDAYYLETQQAYKKAEQNLIDAKRNMKEMLINCHQ